MKRTVLILIILSFISRVSGFLREIVLAWRFGASIHTDTYIAALTVPVLVMSFITTGLNSALIPVLSKAEKDGNKTEFFNRLISGLLVFSALLMVLIIILARPLNMVIVRGFQADDIERVIYYSRMLAIVALLQIISYSIMGYLQQNNRFYVAATASIPQNFGTIAGALLTTNPTTITVMVIGTIVGYVFQLLWVLYPMMIIKYPFKFDLSLNDEKFKLLLFMIVPTIITLSVAQINGIINKALASGMAEGSISLLNYAQKVNALFYQTMVVTLSTVLFTKQSKLSSEKNWSGIFTVTKENLSNVMLIIVPLMLGTIFLSTELMQLIFQRGAFTLEDSIKAGTILMLYSPGLIAMSANELFSKMFFSMQQPNKPMIATVANISLNIVLNLMVYKRFGINGLAATKTIASLTAIIILGIMAQRLFRKQGIKIWTTSYLHYALSGSLMILVLLIFRIIPGVTSLPVLLYTALCGLIGCLSYFGSLLLFKNPELKRALALVDHRIRPRKL